MDKIQNPNPKRCAFDKSDHKVFHWLQLKASPTQGDLEGLKIETCSNGLSQEAQFFYSLFVHLNKHSGIMRTLNVSISELEYNKFGVITQKQSV
jgi:hypothetical protein